MTVHRTLRIALATLAVAFALPASIAAQAVYEVPKGDGEQLERPAAAQEAIDQLKSPYCPTMLEVCSSGAGAALRDSIVERAMDGWTSEELVQWVIDNHGEEYRALPKAEGKALVAWIVPPLGVAFGVVVLAVALKGMIRSEDELEVVAVGGSLSEDDEELLRDAMRELDEEEEATFF